MSKGDKVYIVYVFYHNRFVERNAGCSFIERKRLKIFASYEDAKDWVDKHYKHYMEYMTEDEEFVDIDIIPVEVN